MLTASNAINWIDPVTGEDILIWTVYPTGGDPVDDAVWATRDGASEATAYILNTEGATFK